MASNNRAHSDGSLARLFYERGLVVPRPGYSATVNVGSVVSSDDFLNGILGEDFDHPDNRVLSLPPDSEEWVGVRNVSLQAGRAHGVNAQLAREGSGPGGGTARAHPGLPRLLTWPTTSCCGARRWTREQAIEYMASTTGSADSEVRAEIERYMAWPGQALGYKMGMLRILEPRERARATLGDAFDLRPFHDVVLLSGAVPMEILEARIVSWARGEV